jgi:hypothetical protein
VSSDGNVRLEENVPGVGSVGIEFVRTPGGGPVTVSNLELEACVEPTGMHYH